MNKTEDEDLEEIKRKKMEELMKKAERPELPDSPVTLTDNNFQKTINKYPVLVADFWSHQCPACNTMDRVIKSVAGKYSEEVVFGKLNVNQNPMTKRKFHVKGVPTLIFFKNGDLVERVVGATPKRVLETKLDKLID